MDNFITGDIWSEVNKRLTKQQNKTACIAYVTTDNLELSEGDILICDASNYAIKRLSAQHKTAALSAKVLDAHPLTSRQS